MSIKHEIFTSDDLPAGQPFPEDTADQNILSSPALLDRLEKLRPGTRDDIRAMSHELRFPHEYNKKGEYKILVNAFWRTFPSSYPQNYERGKMLRPVADAFVVTACLRNLKAEGEDLTSLGLPQRLIDNIEAPVQDDKTVHLRRD